LVARIFNSNFLFTFNGGLIVEAIVSIDDNNNAADDVSFINFLLE